MSAVVRRWSLALLLLASLLRPVSADAATIGDRLEEHGVAARAAWKPRFAAAGIKYPPKHLALIGLKDEKLLQIYARNAASDPWVWVHELPITAASGGPGPKLREGDNQVPEGIYRIELLNPNSRFHLSLRVSYPNAEDRARGKADGRSSLGGDIMIHGNAVSIGCIAIGDSGIEELFVLAADTGLPKIEVIIVPLDFRVRTIHEIPDGYPEWTWDLWEDLKLALADFPLSSPVIPGQTP